MFDEHSGLWLNVYSFQVGKTFPFRFLNYSNVKKAKFLENPFLSPINCMGKNFLLARQRR